MMPTSTRVSSAMIGPYRIDGLIGRGGMGEVYRAFDTVKQRAVALKLLAPHLAGDVEFQERFRRESELAARLREPHVIPIHDYGTLNGRLFIDMRLVDGMDLDAVLGRYGPLSPQRAVEVISQIAGALDAAHADGLVHRDVKPSNILLTVPGTEGEFAYLVDFGIAAPMAGNKLTVTGTTMGSLDYMAPELFDTGDRRGNRIDVYALTGVLHTLLTGSRPFTADGLAGMMFAHLNAAPPRPTRLRPLPPALDAVVARGMAKRPDDRFATCGELAAAAHAAIVGSPTTWHPGPPARPLPPAPSLPPAGLTSPPPVRARRRWPLVAAAVAAVLLAGGGTVAGVVANSGSPPEVVAPAAGTYTDVYGRFTIQPPAGWSIDPSSEVLAFNSPTNDAQLAVFVVSSLGTLEETIEGARNAAVQFPNGVITSGRKLTLADGTPAYLQTYSYTDQHPGAEAHDVQLVAVRGSELYTLIGSAPASAQAERDTLTAAVQTLRLK
ncbi:serine/threonine-protein kinase [Pseudonocardia sp. TRM90224]|uniref:serine/threonine-protein kinase n=1 Tax=Pseudonocardia sp. TRM90224 TaxID=2812678 RepID=UPI001E5FEF6B|nr:serine/threonine-protein kinase [Pseudonocardia sp. TRM90224]